jgi:hypothetical protein
MFLLLEQLIIGFFSFFAPAVYSTNEANKAGLKQSILLDFYGSNPAPTLHQDKVKGFTWSHVLQGPLVKQLADGVDVDEQELIRKPHDVAVKSEAGNLESKIVEVSALSRNTEKQKQF